MSIDAVDAALLEESLRECRRELAVAHERNEVMLEHQAAAEQARHRLAELAKNLDARLTRAERSSAGLRGWLKRRLNRAVPTPDELSDAKELRKSRMFDGVWYFSTYPEVAKTGLSAALHYLRRGAAEGKDPGPEFSTKHYVVKHPLLARTGVNPLLNHLRTGQ